jgi:hypothetical protein
VARQCLNYFFSLQIPYINEVIFRARHNPLQCKRSNTPSLVSCNCKCSCHYIEIITIATIIVTFVKGSKAMQITNWSPEVSTHYSIRETVYNVIADTMYVCPSSGSIMCMLVSSWNYNSYKYTQQQCVKLLLVMSPWLVCFKLQFKVRSYFWQRTMVQNQGFGSPINSPCSHLGYCMTKNQLLYLVKDTYMEYFSETISILATIFTSFLWLQLIYPSPWILPTPMLQLS